MILTFFRLSVPASVLSLAPSTSPAPGQSHRGSSSTRAPRNRFIGEIPFFPPSLPACLWHGKQKIQGNYFNQELAPALLEISQNFFFRRIPPCGPIKTSSSNFSRAIFAPQPSAMLYVRTHMRVPPRCLSGFFFRRSRAGTNEFGIFMKVSSLKAASYCGRRREGRPRIKYYVNYKISEPAGLGSGVYIIRKFIP